MSELSHPHDRFFSKIFSQVDIAEDILMNNIPLIANLIEPGTLEICREKFVNSDLKKYYADILLKARLKNGEEVYIYLLLEHKSFHEPKVVFELMGYMHHFWRTELTKNKLLPFIFPVVIYHGKQPWTSSTGFVSLVSIPEGMNAYVPQFEFYLFDLSQYSDHELKGHIRSRVLLLIMKHIFQYDFGDRFIQICKLLNEMGDEKTALDLMRSILEYIGNASDKVSKEQVQEGVRSALPLVGDKVMPTLFERLREEGRQEGHQEGIRLAIELKYGPDGLEIFDRMKDRIPYDTLNKITDALRNDATLDDFEKLLKENQS